VEFVWRYQNSYRFDPNTNVGFGFFPGISVGYKISNEDFFRNNVSFINDLKLRGSWGRTGLDELVEWNYLTTYATGGIRAQSWNAPLPFITNFGVEIPPPTKYRFRSQKQAGNCLIKVMLVSTHNYLTDAFL
jgi:hypothetical protein